MNPIIYEPEEVAKMFGCTVSTVEHHARTGNLPGVKFGIGWKFPAEALVRAVNRIAEDSARALAQPPKPQGVKMPKRKRLPDLGQH